MDDTRFTSMVERLEQKAAAHPSRYKTEVALLAVAGFALLAVVLVIAGLGLAILAGVVLAALFTGGAALLVLLKFGKLLIFLAVPLWFLIKGSIKALLVRLPEPSGLELKRAQAPALFEAIDDMRRTLRGPRIHHVKIVDEVNAAMVQRPLLGMVGPSRNHLLLGLPLLESMTPQEAMAVVAHEYGHLAGAHGRFEAFIYRQRIAWGTIQQLADQWEGRVGRWLATWVGRFAPYFNAYTFVLARANEYQADRASADLVGAAAAQAALKRVNVAGALHGDFMGRTYEGVRTLPEPPADLTLRWADEARGSPALADAAPRWLANALDRRGAPLDTHPPLRQRLAALDDPAVVGTGTAEGTPAASPGAGLADPPVLVEPPAPLAGPSAAQAWLGTALPALREQLASAWADAVREGWAERHAQWTSGAARLAELRALRAPTPPEQLECLRLARSHEPQVDRREAAAAFTAAHPDEPGGWFVCAQVALDHDDLAAAAAAFERAMALDADAIKPACDQMYGWLREHGDTAAAEPWAQRWRERDALEQQRTREFQALDPAHALAPREIPEPAAGELMQRILGAKRTGVRALYLVRRHLPADPALLTHVLVVDAGLWVRWRNTPHDLVKRYIDLEWPTAVLVTVPPRSWRGAWPAWWRTLRAMPGARIL